MNQRVLSAAVPFLALVAIAFGCSKDDNPVSPVAPATGSLFVRVLDSAAAPVRGAVVMLNPSGRVDTTDALGTVFIEGLDPGNYTVLTSKPLIGSGKAVLTVKSDEVADVTLRLVSGVYFEPSVSILVPGGFSEFSYVDSVQVVASVADLEDRASALRLTWRSNRDGELSTAPARADGIATLVARSLSLGDHWIALYAEDSDSRIGGDSIAVRIRSFPPLVFMTGPAYPAMFTPGAPITVSAMVDDRETPTENLVVEWSGSIDGSLAGGITDPSGSASITSATLSGGDQWIRVVATDADGNSARDSIMIHNVLPGVISLEQPTVESSRVNLRWTRAVAEGFDRYEVYRSTTPGISRNGSPLRTITSLSDTAWVDSLPPFAAQTYYRVYVVNAYGYDRGSEERAVAAAGGLLLPNVSVDDAVLHPTQPWIYLNERSSGKITVVDYRAMAVLRTLTIGGWSGFLDLVDNGYGLELYVPRSDGWVEVRDPNDLHVLTSINTGLSNTSVVGDGRGNVFVSMSPSPWWERPLRSYRRSDGSYVDGNGDFEACRLRLLQGGQEIIEITTSVSPVDMDYYLLGAGGEILRHKDDIQHGGTPLDPYLYRVSPARNYLVTSSYGAVYVADSTMAYVGQLPRGSLTFGDFAFSEDGGSIYAGCNNEKLVRIHAYPGLGETGYLQTRGYPQFLWKVGNELVSLSRTVPSSYYYGSYDLGIEILPLPQAVQGAYPRLHVRRAAGADGLSAAKLRPAPAGR